VSTEPSHLTTEEAAALVRLSAKHFREAAPTWGLEPVRIGGRLLWDRVQVETLLAVGATAAEPLAPAKRDMAADCAGANMSAAARRGGR
jgi:hypothetical protein